MQSLNSQGVSVRDQLLSVQRQTGKPLEELQNPPELPESCNLVWNWYTKLEAARGSNGFGPSAFTYSDILAFFALEGITPETWEVEFIKALDHCALQNFSENQKQQQKEQEAKQKRKASK